VRQAVTEVGGRCKWGGSPFLQVCRDNHKEIKDQASVRVALKKFQAALPPAIATLFPCSQRTPCLKCSSNHQTMVAGGVKCTHIKKPTSCRLAAACWLPRHLLQLPHVLLQGLDLAPRCRQEHVQLPVLGQRGVGWG
jgi:hypothetical protein